VQVLLGLGLATLVAANGLPAVCVANVDGARVAGVLLQAGPKPTSTLLQWGNGAYGGDAANPGVLSDVFARVGGPDTATVQARSMLEVNSSHVLGDNLWLWRADHTVQGLVKNGDNPCLHGMRVHGDDVTMYGAAVEHTLQDLTQWHGERGRSYFYQSESAPRGGTPTLNSPQTIASSATHAVGPHLGTVPYDVTQAGFGDLGYVGYRVAPSVRDHDAWGTGVYHYFRDYAVTVRTGIVAPDALVPRFASPLAVYLNGMGTVQHVINDLGNQTDSSQGTGSPSYYCGSTRAPQAAAAAVQVTSHSRSVQPKWRRA
jgi:hypothetical protein